MATAKQSKTRKPAQGMSRVVVEVPTEHRRLLDRHQQQTGVPITRVVRDLLAGWARQQGARADG